jgi:hypothetical protein
MSIRRTKYAVYDMLVTSDVFEEICYVAISDSFRSIVSAAEIRQHAPKVESRTLSRRNITAKVADTL